MSLIAINMKMPESCLQCPLENEHNECSVYTGYYVCGDPNYCTYEYSDQRPDWCPLCSVEEVWVEHIVDKESFERYGKDSVKDGLMRETSAKIGNTVVNEKMCKWSSSPVDKQFYPFADRIRAIAYIVRPKGAGGCPIE